MHKKLFPFLFFFGIHAALAQTGQLNFTASYGFMVADNHPDKTFSGIGGTVGLELKIKKHMTLGLDIDWQRFESEPAFATPFISSSGLPIVPYTIERYQFNIRPAFRYYFSEAPRGLYAGVFATYSYLTITTAGYPEDSGYFSGYKDPGDEFAPGLGLTYGYRLKLNNHFQASIAGNTQMYWNDIPKHKQFNQELGLGLNWVF